MQGKIRDLTGMKAKLANWGLETKLENLHEKGEITHGFFDKLIFKKFREGLGGRVRMMITGSAPISKEVIDFFKVTMSCNMFEGYGQTELCAASSLTLPTERTAGHVGGPMP